MALQPYTAEDFVIAPLVSKKRVKTKEQEIETEELEQWERGTRMPPKVDADCQTELIEVDESEVDLTGFIGRVVPIMLDQLSKTTRAFQFYEATWEDDNQLNLLLHTLSPPVVEEEFETTVKGEDFFAGGDKVQTVKLQATAACWNSSGALLAVGYSRLSHDCWCSHRGVLRVYRLFRREPKPYELEVEGCITALRFHTIEPNILVGASFNGQMFMWDLNRPDPLVSASVIDEYLHSEAISSVIWPATGVEEPMLLSLGADGKVLHWHESLEFPKRGFLVRSKGTVEGGYCMSSFPDDTSVVVVGSETGRVFKLNIPAAKTGKLPAGGMKWKPEAEFILNNAVSAHRQQLKALAERYCQDTGRREVDPISLLNCKPELSILYSNSVSFAYEQHDGKVTGVSCSPFQRNLFATASSDGTVRIYTLLQAKALMVLQPQIKVRLTAVSWSSSRPTLIAVGASNSCVYLYDFSKNKAQPQSFLEGDGRSAVTQVAFSKTQRDFLAVAYYSGEVRVFQLSHGLTTLQSDDLRVLRDLMETD
mmetsp:Transcript_31609/g.54737  ORF Transcript_31609/g.54737 Transcript_31609/m.54737 type:complete len:536 (-) Transcript_31609:93-1700(-)|eukprot:CAMPEP_0204906886 /NCGR_PEP_ID=MMETSP1397-20131031/6206_1 /ASSEMBLY_ACC=CAM_ASM_000891 /TAXON_ID=49980 /ORGANISM="Climacostomum Climacostomum virens, Strain Stock W-24" /LENGTH=535 /DNA_ID=CAMNT_0052075891 /DNA_START=356 /DNA_END=1963 /DNA_ORIENTATION=+